MKRFAAMLFVFAPAAAQPLQPANPLAMFDRLVGSCWTTDFVPVGATIAPDATTDTHCFSALYEGVYVRDAHRVSQQGKVNYRGETTYRRSGEQVEFVYLNSQGGEARGTAAATPQGIEFKSGYQAPGDVSPRQIAARWRWSGRDSYDVWDEDYWIRYSRGGAPEQP